MSAAGEGIVDDLRRVIDRVVQLERERDSLSAQLADTTVQRSDVVDRLRDILESRSIDRDRDPIEYTDNITYADLRALLAALEAP